MLKGDPKSFLKKVFRFLFGVLKWFVKSKLEQQLDIYFKQIFDRFGVPKDHINIANSLKNELSLRCDAIITGDMSKNILADIEASNREDFKDGKYDTFEGVLTSINLSKGTRYTLKDVTVSEFYEVQKKIKDA